MPFLLPPLLLCALVAQDVEFNRDVRPVLSDKCFACHGPDAKNKNIALRLDVERAAKADLGGGRRAIVPGDSAASELIRRVTASQPSRRMPPAFTGHALNDAEIDMLRRWIDQGAKWQAHWAYLAPRQAAPPSVRNATWIRNPIDAFVLARLDKEGLQPSPEATREAWLRRVSLDLTGIPPSPQEVDAFVRDSSARAYETVVDRLLASPRYGERMAIRWLDAARYADTNGYQYDGERVMWRWRDWVIDTFNRNQRYDQFVVEQIAGDLLPGSTLAQKIATGFNRNHRGNTEDGIIPAEYAVEYVADRVETASTVFLGLTVGCARCHNHKYDPLTQKEYYQLFAYFNNIPENGRAMKYGNSPPLIAAPTESQSAQWREMNAQIANVRSRLDAAVRELGQTPLAAWTPRVGLDTRWEPGDPTEIAAGAPFDIRDRWTLAARVDGRNGPVISKMVNTARGKGFGIYLREGRIHVHITSNFADDAIRLDTVQPLEPGAHHIAVTYDGTVASSGIRVLVDGKVREFKATQDTLYRPFVNAGGIFKEPLRIGAGGGKDLQFDGAIREVRVYGRVLREHELRALAEGARSPEFARNEYLETDSGPAGRLFREHESLIYAREKLERSFPSVMVMQEMQPRKDTFLLQRGAYDKPGEKVEPGVPAALPPLPAGVPNNRLGLAKWLVDPANPLTARVAVNRFWQMLFGVGLVKTVEDFGVQGDWPSHPELLDWMAVEFVKSGWDVKALVKQLVLSATYRQSSNASPELMQKDPENRLLARGPRHRLPAEMIRDQALALAGLLHEKLGGPSVKPYQPEGLWKDQIMQDMYYVQGHGEDLYRRSLYTFWKRTVAPPMMVTFDAPGREACVVRENRTNTPLQALNLMNDVTFLEAARGIAQRMMREGGADPLGYGFRLVTARLPNARERAVLEDSLRYHRDYFASSNDGRAAQFLAQGESPRDAKLEVREHAALTAVASLILNLDEAVTKQ